MFNSISWTQYFEVVVLLLIVYYFYVGAKFYSPELRSFLRFRSAQPSSIAIEHSVDNAGGDFSNNNQSEIFSSHERYAPKFQDTDDTFKQVEELITKLKVVIEDASSKNYHTEEFIFLLQLTLKEYPHLKGSPFQVAINNLIESECEKHGSLHLSAEEQVMLWKGVA